MFNNYQLEGVIMDILWIKLLFMLVGIAVGIVLTWTFVGDKYWKWKIYKDEYGKIYNEYHKLEKYSCEAYWILRHNYFKDKEYRSVDEAFFELNNYFDRDDIDE